MKHATATPLALPPQAIALEKSVLGIMLSQGRIHEQVLELLSAESFYTPAHATLYAQMCALDSRGIPTDPITLAEHLRTTGRLDEVGGIHYIEQLANSTITGAPLLHHAIMLKEKQLKRQQLAIAASLQQMAQGSDDVFDTFARIEQELYSATHQAALSNIAPLDKVALQVLKNITEARAAASDLTGVTTGYRELDLKTNGWQPTDLVVVAARPGVGKTAFSLNLALNCAAHPAKPTAVALFNLEMQDTQVVKRGIAAMSRVPLEHINRPKSLSAAELDDIHHATRCFKHIPLYIEDTPALSTAQLRSKMRRYITRHGIGLVIIDYLQLMACDKKTSSREQEVSQISRDLKCIAKELKVPIIALSQLNRDIERRASKEPTLADLRESGAIEQDADMILFLYRPSDDAIKEDASLADKVALSCKKHRNGDLFDMVMRFEKGVQRFGEV